MLNKNITLEQIKELMKPLHSDNHRHTALINSDDGKHAINISILRWAGGAKQLTLTTWELPPDACGRIYVVDTFIGDVVAVKYADWAERVRRGEYLYTGTSHTKGEYKTFPHIMLDYIDGSKKRRHYRPMMHTIIAYVSPDTREQYAKAALLDMQEKGRTFLEAQVQVNHMDKDVHNNALYNLEVVTASENNRHRSKTIKGVPYSAICDRNDAHPELRAFEAYGVMEARRAYLDKLCKQLSQSEIKPDTTELLVKSVSCQLVPVSIKDLTAWGILTQLFLAQSKMIVGVK